MRAPALLAVLFSLAGLGGRAEGADPFALLGGRLVFGAEGSFALAGEDRGYFNYTDYERSVVRLARLGLSAELRATRHVSLLTELRSENLDSVNAYALYLRCRPWLDRDIDFQAGRIPPVFGAFSRRRYGPDNPLIGVPLAYQYLTSLRADAMPADADELEGTRGEGWLVGYSMGDPRRSPGLPLVNGLRWDTGAEMRVGLGRLSLSAAATQGTLSSPRFRDDNSGKQLSARLAWEPVTGLVVGGSAARGSYVDGALRTALPASQAARDYLQRAWGLDAEYSRAHWLLRSEAVWSSWDVPVVDTPLLPDALAARAVMLEGRLKVAPGLWLAARLEHLGFARVTGSRGSFDWDAPVTRIEAGAGYMLHRNASLKAAWQHGRRDGGFVRRQDLAVVQVLLWY